MPPGLSAMIQVDTKMKPGLRVDVQQVLKPGFRLGEIKMAFVIGAGATPIPRTLRPEKRLRRRRGLQ